MSRFASRSFGGVAFRSPTRSSASRFGLLDRRAMLGASLIALSFAYRNAVEAKPASLPRKIGRTLAGPGKPFTVGFDGGCITSLRDAAGHIPGDFLHAAGRLGNVTGCFRSGMGEWQQFDTADLDGEIRPLPDGGLSVRYAIGQGLELTCRFSLDEAGLHLAVSLANHTPSAVEFGDVALPLPINKIHSDEKDPDALLKHSFISGRSSHIFWQRKDLKAPWLAMLPAPGTALECWDRPGDAADSFRIHVQGAAQVAAWKAAGSRWRLPATSLVVPAGESRARGLRFFFVSGYEDMRRTIAENGLLDIEVVPGMSVPTDLDVLLSIRSSVAVRSLTAEHGEATQVRQLPERAGRQVFQLRFSRLGENHVTVEQVDGGITTLEFFVTQPVETMIAKRGAFIAAHRYRDPGKWYDGLLAEWNMESEVLLGPDNYDRIKGWRIYEVTCDDPGLSKPAFLAAKNAEFPVQTEIDALDDYVEHFVWGGLQRSTDESNAYAIYGIPDWKQNRDSSDPGPKGQQHFWRPYDYPHIVLMYYSLFRIARDQPGTRTRLPASEYLERAFGTARAMFVIPKAFADWEANSIGYYNEIVIPDLIAALRVEGHAAQAEELTAIWEHKVSHFIDEVDDLFVSEYAFDSTGFESTQAIARYALDRPERFSPARARAFSRHQMQSNLFCRGWLQPAYYTLGSDYRADAGDSYLLSYMAQMGGWAILDHALNDAEDARPLLRLGHASALSSWALLNSGTAESEYGYWYPGKANDGAAGGGFEPAALGKTWLDQPHRHGSWYYSCEIDLGFCGALRAARTTLVDDDLFGRIAIGGTLAQRGKHLLVEPRDGVRRRFHARLAGASLDMELSGGARFAGRAPIVLSSALDEWEITLEHQAGPARKVFLRLDSPTIGNWRIRSEGGKPSDMASGIVEIEIATGTCSTKVRGHAF